MTEKPSFLKPRSMWNQEDWKIASSLIEQGKDEEIGPWSDKIEKTMKKYETEGEAAMFRLLQYIDKIIEENPKLEQIKKLRDLVREPIIDLSSYRNLKTNKVNIIFEKLGVNSFGEFLLGIESAVIRSAVKEILKTYASINVGISMAFQRTIDRLESGDALYEMDEERRKIKKTTEE